MSAVYDMIGEQGMSAWFIIIVTQPLLSSNSDVEFYLFILGGEKARENTPVSLSVEPGYCIKVTWFYPPYSSGSLPVAHRCIRLRPRTEQHGQWELLPDIPVSISQDIEAQTRGA